MRERYVLIEYRSPEEFMQKVMGKTIKWLYTKEKESGGVRVTIDNATRFDLTSGTFRVNGGQYNWWFGRSLDTTAAYAWYLVYRNGIYITGS